MIGLKQPQGDQLGNTEKKMASISLGVGDGIDVDDVAVMAAHLLPPGRGDPASKLADVVGDLGRWVGEHEGYVVHAGQVRSTDPLAQMRIGLGTGSVEMVAVVVEVALVAVEVDDPHPAMLDALVDVTAQGMAPAGVVPAVLEPFPAGHPGEMRALDPVRRHRTAVVAEGVVATVGVAEALHQRRMGGHHVVALHERFLAGLPVHRHQLADMGGLVAPLERHEGEVVGQVAEEVATVVRRCGRG